MTSIVANSQTLAIRLLERRRGKKLFQAILTVKSSTFPLFNDDDFSPRGYMRCTSVHYWEQRASYENLHQQ